MADGVFTGILTESSLRVVAVVAGESARRARSLHRLEPAAAELLARALTAGALLAALQKEGSAHVNLQLECDGALRGLFVDATGGTEGTVRGYVKNPLVGVSGGEGEYRFRPALGNSGFLSVLREVAGGEPYRSSVALAHFDLARDLEEFFRASEQLPAVVLLDGAEQGGDALGSVGGLLVQPLPGGDLGALEQLGRALSRPGALREVLVAKGELTAVELASAMLSPRLAQAMSSYPLVYRCTCSHERMMRALGTLSQADLEQMLKEDGKATLTCQFCSTRYELSATDLGQLLAAARKVPSA